ncbi:MAG: hypothetical protein IJW55_06730 [Clostridia bacterium]|nr:hypothetical protein [Clostridia bacterium]
MDNMLIETIRRNSIQHGSLPFWSWNDKLEKEELAKQIRNMSELSMNGFFMHARGGLETEYMSDEWFDCIKFCVSEAEKYGMEAWAYDENGWPSGFANGKLLENSDNHAVFLKHEIADVFPDSLEEIYAVYALAKNQKPKRVTQSIAEAEHYLLVFYCTDPSYVDTLRADVTDQFIQTTHVEYQKRLGNAFGTSMPGFFTDEPQYYRYHTPYSKLMDEWFWDEYGYSVFEAIPALFYQFDGAERYRYDYWRMAHTKFITNFIKKIYDWAEENRIQITGHGIDENSLAGQMMCCGGIMPFYEYEHIPGVDYLGRPVQSPTCSKQLGSVCAQLNKKKALSEMYACCGWAVTPKELKLITDLQYANGVNVTCQHLYPYSERGQRKRDYPAHYSKHNPWQAKLKAFNEYYNHLGTILSMGHEVADIVVIHPIHSAWLHYMRFVDKGGIADMDREFRDLTRWLSFHQIPYHFADEWMMERYAKVENEVLIVGECRYRKVILPAMDNLDANTVALLQVFKQNGGEIISYRHHLPTYVGGRKSVDGNLAFLNGISDLTDVGVYEQLGLSMPFTLHSANGETILDIISMVRDTEYGRLFYLTNIGMNEYRNVRLSVNGVNGLGSIDMMTLEMRAIRGYKTSNGSELLLDFEGGASYVLCEYNAPKYLPYAEQEVLKTIKLCNPFVLHNMPENLMTLDRAAISFDGASFSEERPIEQIRDNLLHERYAGKVWLRFSFYTELIPQALEVVFEKVKVNRVFVNGKPLGIGSQTWLDTSFATVNIADQITVGENFVTLEIDYFQNDYVYHVLFDNVMESLRNCLVFDTEIEAVYLRGTFCVRCEGGVPTADDNDALRYPPQTKYIMTSQRREIDPTNIVTDGYPFYGGELELETELNYREGDPTLLCLGGRYAVCDVEVNGQTAGTLMFSKYMDLKPYLTSGKNKLILKICAAYRNLLGPHHSITAENLWVSPNEFTFEGQWEGDQCRNFYSGYSFVRFGIDDT